MAPCQTSEHEESAMTYLVTQASGYAVRARGRDEVHECETHQNSYCCDRGCAWRFMLAIGVPAALRTHPFGHGGGSFIDLRDRDVDDMGAPIVSWGEWPCPETSSHEYCPACGALTVEGIESDHEALPYVDPDPCMGA
jgi:hypothetical protein